MRRFLSVIFLLITFMNFSFSQGTDVATSSGPDKQNNIIDSDISSIQEIELQTEDLAGGDGMQRNISLDLRNTDIGDALKYISLKAGINVMITKNVTGRVTFTVENVKIQDIFDIMIRSNELAYIKQGDIYNVMTEEEYKSLYGERFSDTRITKTFRLRYAIPEQAFVLLDTLKSDIGRILVEPDSGMVLIMDTPEKIKEVEIAMNTLEQRNVVRVYTLNYANAKDVEEKLQLQIDSKKVGSIKADERLNQIIVQALPDRIHDIEMLIQALDGRPKEVRIDARIIKIRLFDGLSSGVEWEGLLGIGKSLGMSYLGSYPFSAVQASGDDWKSRLDQVTDMNGNIGSYPFSGTTTDYSGGSTVKPGESMHLGVVDANRDFDVVIKYLQTLGDTRIISNPRIAVLNNQEAKIHVGAKQAYVTTTTTSGQATTTVSEDVTFVDVGIQLQVTPTISDDGYVTMKIKPEISSVISTLITPSRNEIPIIDTSMAETTVLVKDGATIIIGGLSKEENIMSSDQVPFLGKIPLLGFFFKTKSDSTERTELLVMITPTIVTGDRIDTGNARDVVQGESKGYENYEQLFEKEKQTLKLSDNIGSSQGILKDKIKLYREYRSDEKIIDNNNIFRIKE